MRALVCLISLLLCHPALAVNTLARPCADALGLEFTVFDRMSDEAVALIKANETSFKQHIESQVNWGRLDLRLSVGAEVSEYKEERDLFPKPMHVLWKNKTKFIEWAVQLRNEVLQEMVREGAADIKSLKNPYIWDKYVDRILLARAISNGFSHKRFNAYVMRIFFSNANFGRVLKEKKIFDDKAGAGLFATIEDEGQLLGSTLKHHRRGHAFQLDYAASEFTGFLDFYSSMGGMLGGSINLWSTFFDNSVAGPGLSWPGRVVEYLQILMPVSE